MASFGIFTWLTLNLLAISFISKRNASLGILPNLTLGTFILIYIVPILLNHEISSDLFFSVIISNLILLVVYVYLASRNSRYANQKLITQEDLQINNLSIFIAVSFCIIGNAATFYSLIMSGGLLSVISEFGGRGYLAVRVKGENSGILGILAWFSPFSLAFIFGAALSNKKKFYWILFISFFIATSVGYGLVTVRHNMVATLIMLLLTYMAFRKVSLIVLLGCAATLFFVLAFFQSIRVSGVEEFTVEGGLSGAGDSSEHISTTEYVIKETNVNGFSFFAHASDFFVFLIPRAIWKEKPETSMLNRTFFPNVAAVGSEKAIGLVAEGYASLGFLGVALNSVAFALLIARLQVYLNRMWRVPRASFVAIALVPISYIGVRTGFLGKHLITFLVVYIQCVILTGTSRYKLATR